MELIGLNCSHFLNSLLSNFCIVLAENLLKEFDPFYGRVISEICGLECKEGILTPLAFLSEDYGLILQCKLRCNWQ